MECEEDDDWQNIAQAVFTDGINYKKETFCLLEFVGPIIYRNSWQNIFLSSKWFSDHLSECGEMAWDKTKDAGTNKNKSKSVGDSTYCYFYY